MDSEWVVVDDVSSSRRVDEEDPLARSFVVLNSNSSSTYSPSASSSAFTYTAPSTGSKAATHHIRIPQQVKNQLRSSRDNVQAVEEEETSTLSKEDTTPATTDALEDEDVNDELIELETAHNDREADEAEERRLLDVLRTSAEATPKQFSSEEELLMEIIASENFGMDENPFNDPDRNLANDAMIALALTMEETAPHRGAPLWLQQQRQQQLQAQNLAEIRAARQRELKERIAIEVKLEMEKQENLRNLMTLLSESDSKQKKETEHNKERNKDAGTILTWGRDDNHGCLGRKPSGDKEKTYQVQSVPLPSNVRILKVAVGKTHTVALSETGDLWVCGSTTRGQLGTGETGSPIHTPITSLLTGINVRHVACGALHTVCLTDAGKAIAFGDNSCGQLGVHPDVGSSYRTTPIIIAGIQALNVVKVACGAYHTALITDTGNLYTFGSNSDGQLGLDSVGGSHTPSLVAALHNQGVVAVACGTSHTVAIVGQEADVYVWGRGADGRLGLDDKENKTISKPTLNPFFKGLKIQKIACGEGHSLALSSQGRVYSWGVGREGQLGHGSFNSIGKPKALQTLFGVPIKDIECGEKMSAAISETGELYTWGLGRNYQLASGTLTKNESSPVIATSISNRFVKQLSCGSIHCAAIVESMSSLSTAMESIFNNRDAQPDVVLVCEGKHIYCHRAVLSLRCLYFRAFLQKSSTETHPTIIAINISNIRYQPLFYLIKFLYTEDASFPEDVVDEIKIIADKMRVPQFEDRIKPNSPQRERLGAELVSIINSPTFSNIIFKFENEEDADKELHAHKAIIGARSTYFRGMFLWKAHSHELSATKETAKKEVIVVGCSYEVMINVLQYIYGGKPTINGDNVVELFEISHQYSLFSLKQLCEEFLLEGLDVDNVLSLMRLADLHEAINLRNACVEFAAVNYEAITTNPEVKDDWLALKEQEKQLLTLIENKRHAIAPKPDNTNNASWQYWYKKTQDEDEKIFYEDDEEDEEEDYEDDDEEKEARTSTKKKDPVNEAHLFVKVRQHNGYSQKDFAYALGIKEHDVRSIESGKMKPSRQLWQKIDRSYNVERPHSRLEAPQHVRLVLEKEAKKFVGKAFPEVTVLASKRT
eukprot:TRINITY_DN493_c0_g1_i2.p1 TRINITY_DN493_c0_g1~~TRINITY_DN493_c0_g1_i2.p1  ORF type:complete len:1112 (+),score=366.40 TRINITY_DN493_c0_g1_i2:185-3520(+)